MDKRSSSNSRNEKNGVPRGQKPRRRLPVAAQLAGKAKALKAKADLAAPQTSWGKVANWYDDLLQRDDDTYQAQVILPNLMRMLSPQEGETVVDLGCGQGYFAREVARHGVKVIGIDPGNKLIKIAEERTVLEKIPRGLATFRVASAENAPMISKGTADAIMVVLALQNMADLDGVMTEAKRILKPKGRMLVVLNHPAFRIPKRTSWGFDMGMGVQFRRVDTYLSRAEFMIDMTPGEQVAEKKIMTKSFHRSLQDHMKAFAKQGFAVTRLEEWISHRQSQKGPRQAAEDKTRREIPLFMCVELKQLQ